jgi:hypothetical protein
MANKTHPFPSIAGITALHQLFHASESLPDQSSITESAYNTRLSKALDDIGIAVTDSFAIGFKGRPVESEAHKASGLDVSKLDKIAAYIMDKESLISKAHLEDLNLPLTWDTFANHIFKTPAHLVKLNDKRYMKFLEKEEREEVNRFIARRYNELGLQSGSIVTYCIYLWSIQNRSAKNSILTIDPIKKVATYYFFPDDLSSTQPETILTTECYSHSNSILNLNLVDEDSSHSSMRVNLLLSVYENFTKLDYVKGVLNASLLNSSVAVSAEVALKKCESYAAAWKDVLSKKIENELALEILNKRYEVSEANIYNVEKLPSYPMFLFLKELEGYYLIQYITQSGAESGADRLQNGFCHISSNGLVTFKFPAFDYELHGYIDQQRLRDGKFITINFYLDNPRDRYDVQYKLEVFKGLNELGREYVEYIYGCYTSYSLGTIYKGDLGLFKLSDREYNSFSEVEQNSGYKLSDSINVSGENSKHLKGLNEKAYKVLVSKRFDHLEKKSESK